MRRTMLFLTVALIVAGRIVASPAVAQQNKEDTKTEEKNKAEDKNQDKG